jgi:3-hydroxyacyl-CoA dehydrogenase
VVIEAVFEDLAVKQGVFRQIDAHARPGAVLATNTSYLDVDAIANATSRPQDVLGLHFFSPANVMKLLEVVRGAQTAPDVLATGMALGKTLKKLPVLCGNAFGFIGNRIYNAYRKQCEFMLEDGAWPEDVDNALTGMGFAMGPFAWPTCRAWTSPGACAKAQAATRDPRERYVGILDRLCEQGRLGRKTGAGYYTYTDGKAAKTTDGTVRGIIEQASARARPHPPAAERPTDLPPCPAGHGERGRAAAGRRRGRARQRHRRGAGAGLRLSALGRRPGVLGPPARPRRPGARSAGPGTGGRFRLPSGRSESTARLIQASHPCKL